MDAPGSEDLLNDEDLCGTDDYGIDVRYAAVYRQSSVCTCITPRVREAPSCMCPTYF